MTRRWQEKREMKGDKKTNTFTVLILEYFVYVTHVHNKSQWYEEYLLEKYSRQVDNLLIWFWSVTFQIMRQ